MISVNNSTEEKFYQKNKIINKLYEKLTENYAIDWSNRGMHSNKMLSHLLVDLLMDLLMDLNWNHFCLIQKHIQITVEQIKSQQIINK